MKAILVIDIPKDFENREPYFVEGSLFCYVKTNYGKYRYVCDLDKTKLKPMPQRKIVGEIKKVDDFMKSDIQIINEKVSAEIMLNTELLLASGYNLCIDEILGEEE